MSFVAFEQRGPIGVLTMNRPEALNALNEQVLRDLNAALDAVEANDEVLVVILTGAGRSFVAGADIGQMKDLTPVQAKKFGSYGNQVFWPAKRPSSDSLRWAWASPPASAAPSAWPASWASPMRWS